MSGFGRATPRAWRRGVVRGRSSPSTRDDELDAEALAKRAAELAPVLGFCPACGADVDEANGRLHLHDCWGLPDERRRPARSA